MEDKRKIRYKHADVEAGIKAGNPAPRRESSHPKTPMKKDQSKLINMNGHTLQIDQDELNRITAAHYKYGGK